MGWFERRQVSDKIGAAENTGGASAGERRRIKKLNRKKKVTAVAAVALLIVGGSGIAFKEQVNLIAGIAASRVSSQDNSKPITEQIDPNLKENKKAIKIYEEMLNKFRASDFRVFGNNNELLLFGSSNKFSYATCWPYGRAVEATYFMTLIPNIGNMYEEDYQKMIATTEKYWDTELLDNHPGYNPGPSGQKLKSERLTDDNLWIGLILVKEYKKSGDQHALERAKEVFELVIDQWDNKDGGIFWKIQLPGEKNHDKGIVSSAPTIILGIELYKLTHDERYLDWSKQIYDWANNNLRDANDGLYYDHLYQDKNGLWKIDQRKFTYTQGTMIGAMTKLSEVDPVKYPLQNAVDLANRTLDYFDSNGYNNHAFNGILFQNLLHLAAKSNDASFTDRVKQTLTRVTNEIDLSKNNPDLTEYAGAVQLYVLNRVPVEKYSLLV